MLNLFQHLLFHFPRLFVRSAKPLAVFAENSLGRRKPLAVLAEISLGERKPLAVLAEISLGRRKPLAVLAEIPFGQQKPRAVEQEISIYKKNLLRFLKKFLYIRITQNGKKNCRFASFAVISRI